MSAAQQWSIAYAKQARADLNAREALCRIPGIPECEQLHFLQMACEKLAKATLCASGSDPHDLQTSHGYIAKVLPVIARQRVGLRRGKYPTRSGRLIRKIRLLAREIELLCPAVDDNGRRPDNCEYPWEDSWGNLRVPAEHTYAVLGSLREPSGFRLLKIVTKAVDDLAGPVGS